MKSYSVLLLSALMFFNGSRSILAQMEPVDTHERGGSGAECGSTLTAVRAFHTQLNKLDNIVQRISPDLKHDMERFFKLLDKFEHFVEMKFNELDKQMDSKFHETKPYLESKLSGIQDKMTQCYSHIDSKVNILEVSLTHVLNNVSDTFNKNNTCCQGSSGSAAVVVNATKTINELNTRTSGANITLEVQLTDLVPDIVKNISKLDDTIESTTEISHNVSTLNITTEVNKQALSKCDSSQQEECCTVAVANQYPFIKYTNMSAKWRHTVVNMTSAGLQEFTMYFAVKGVVMELLLLPTMPWYDLHFRIGFTDERGGRIYMYERGLAVFPRNVYNLYTTNVISGERYSYYYVTISGDTLEMGRRGKRPLMTHTSSALRRLKSIGFRWRGSTEGEALYDCTAECGAESTTNYYIID